MKRTAEQSINEYLYYGYGISETSEWLIDSCFEALPKGLSYNPFDAGRLLDSVLGELLSSVSSDGFYVVPISGGWDSRILLGAIVERVEAKQVKTLSFGVPGQLDFDLGRIVARAAGVEHHAVDLSDVDVTWDDLRGTVRNSPWTYLFDAFFNQYSISQVASSAADVVLSGFMGDPLTGGHYSSATTRSAAISEFVRKQRWERSVWLPAAGFNPVDVVPSLPDGSSVSDSDLLDLGVRQANCVAPIVAPQRRWGGWGGNLGRTWLRGAAVLGPFAHPAWAAYWLRAPKEAKMGQKLYLEMLRVKFPRLYSLPSKYSLGVPQGATARIVAAKAGRKIQRRLHRLFPRVFPRFTPELNYLDFGTAFRTRDDYQALAETAFLYLEKTNAVPWLKLDYLRAQHFSRKRNNEFAFLVLVGLALNLQEGSFGGISWP